MEEHRQSSLRPTSIPRLSRVPTIASTTPSTSSSTHASTHAPTHASTPSVSRLRPTPSRESLSGGRPSLGGSELRNPKLRSMASRDRLSLPASSPTGSPAHSPLRHPSPRTRAVSGQYVKASNHRSAAAASAASAMPPPPPRTPAKTVGRRPSRPQLAQSPSPSTASYSTTTSHSVSPDDLVLAYDLDESADGGDTIRPKRARPRPSLSERTVETLAQIPSSPAIKGRASVSGFFDGGSSSGRPPSRGGNSSSRPGSRSGPGSSRPSSSSSRLLGSRPGSSSGGLDGGGGPASFRASTNSFSAPGTIDEVPSRPSLPKTRTLRGSPSLSSIGGGRPSSVGSGIKPPSERPRSMAVRPLQSRPSLNRLYKRPSLSSLDAPAPSALPSAAKPAMKPAAAPKKPASRLAVRSPTKPAPKAAPAARKASLASRTSSVSEARSTTSASTALTAESAETGSVYGNRKSSAALREQIAKAKAAKRAASLQAAAATTTSPESVSTSDVASTAASTPATSSSFLEIAQAPLVPTDTTFDFGLSSDPFGQNRPDKAQSQVMRSRLAAARTSGRLNIAALGLRSIPDDVLNMYDAAVVGTQDGSWAESVDLSRFVAADNEIEMIEDRVFPDVDAASLADDDDDGRGNIFGGLETLDLHGNMLISLPMGLRRLSLLTSLNLAQNRITNNALEVISQITSLRDVKLGGNLFYGPLDPCFARLTNLEIADLHGNNISGLPLNMASMAKLRILNLSENEFERIAFAPLAQVPLTELIVRKNKLSGTLIEDDVYGLPALQVLDVSSNQITHLVSDGRALELPVLHQLCVSTNRLQKLPALGAWRGLVTLAADENNIGAVPDGLVDLPALRHADFSSNDIRVVPPEIGRMDNLAMLRLSGNPLRDKKFCAATTDEIKAVLLSRLEPEPEPEPVPEAELVKEPEPSAEDLDELRDAVSELADTTHGRQRSTAATSNGSDDDFATPPTSAQHTPAHSRAHTLSNPLWPVKSGGVLDRSETASAALHPVIAARVAQEHAVREVYLQRNLFTTLPDALSFFANTLTILSLAHNSLTGEVYLGESATAATEGGLELPVLRELNLASNHITGLGPLVRHLRAPLQKIDVSHNRVTALPAAPSLRAAFPDLTVLLAADNHLAALEPESIAGLRIVDVTNNDIEHLNPRIGLLGGEGGSLERLEALGNRFRVPRYNVLERGTEATLRWLRGRVPVAEMGAWREAQRQAGAEIDEDDVD